MSVVQFAGEGEPMRWTEPQEEERVEQKPPPMTIGLHDASQTRPGIYAHYKGDLYRVLFTAMESTNGRERERLMVYVSLAKGTVNVRREEEFRELVSTEQGPQARFAFLRGADE